MKAQTFDLEIYNAEKEKILNVIVNSVQFDSVYTSQVIYFKANELLSEDTQMCIKKGGKRIRINKIINKKQYVVIGDFTMKKDNPTAARVQFEILPQKTLLNIRLEKVNEKWKITRHLIIREINGSAI